MKFEKGSIYYVLLYCGLTAIFIGFITYFALSPIFGCCTAILGTIALLFSFVCKARDKKNFLHQQDLKLQKHIEDVQNNIAPIVEDIPCKHCNGLPIGENSLCQLTVFQDVIYLNSGTMEFQIPMERVRSVDVLTQEQTDTVYKEHFGRTLLAGLIFGELGALISIAHTGEEEITVAKKNLVITYEKDGEAKFIVLNDLPCDEVVREIKKYIFLTPRTVEL